MRRMLVYLLRHGETQANRDGLLLGWTNQPLNENGVAVAVKAKAALDSAGIKFDKVYSSPLIRAVSTAEILAPDVPMVLDPRWKEVHFGDRELDYAPYLRGVTFPNPGGESLEELQTRVVAAWMDVIHDPENSDKKTVLVSTHGTVIKCLLAYLKNQSDILSQTGHGNCCATGLKVDPDTHVVNIVAENVCFCEND